MPILQFPSKGENWANQYVIYSYNQYEIFYFSFEDFESVHEFS